MEIGELFAKRASLLDKIDRRRITRDRGSPRGSCLVRVMSLLGHKRTSTTKSFMSASPSTADIHRIGRKSKSTKGDISTRF